jgi:protease PrsW
MGFLVSLLASFVPMFLCAGLIYWLDRYEKEPKKLLGIVFFWGAFVAAAVAFLLNTFLGVGVYLLTGSEEASNLTTGSLIAPIVEESLKGLAVLIIFWFYRTEFDSILDGIIYAAITALGFAATENTYYIYTYGYLEKGWAGLWSMILIRDFVVIWQHPFYTAFFGIGLAVARINRNQSVRFLAPLLGWIFAVMLHAFHNIFAEYGSGLLCIIGSVLDWSGWIMMLIFIFWLNKREQMLLATFLRPEVEEHILTPHQYEIACSAWKQSMTRFQALKKGNYNLVNQFYQLCGEISHKKNQYEKLGEEKGNSNIITDIRQQLRKLSPQINDE